jgi:hypothetical protein
MEKNSWEIETIRLTVFTPDPPSAQDVGWWRDMTASEPETVQNRPAHALFAASGLVNDLTLSLNLTPGRIDWLFVGASSTDSPLASLGSFDSAAKRFHGLIDQWLDRKPVKMFRIALGVAARGRASDKVDAYKKISGYLPFVKLDPVGSSELLYQINRPSKSRVVPGLAVNRLSKWNVVTVGSTSMVLSGPTVVTPLATFYVAETDINTATDNESNLTDTAKALVAELEDLTGEILEKGDVA